MMAEGSSQELPEGWANASVLELCELIRGVSYAKGEAATTPSAGRVALLRANNIGDGLNFDDLQFVPQSRVSDEQKVRVGDVVIAMSSGSKSVVGKAASIKKQWNGTFGAFCGVLRPSLQIDARYFGLFFQTKHYRNAISEASAGTNINNLKREYFAELILPLAPVAEQPRIVAKAEELLARVDVARERLANAPTILKRFRQSVLAAACSGQLTADWRDGDSTTSAVNEVIAELRREHQACGSKKSRSRRGANAARNEGHGADGLDLSLMPELPDKWTYARADDVVKPGTVVTYGIVLPGPRLDDGVPYVRGLDIENGQVLVDQLWKTTPAIAAKHERSRLEPGDVLLCIIRHLKVAIVPKSLRGGNLTQGTVRLRPSRAILGTYLARYLESPIAQGWLKSRYFGMDMPRVNVEDARAIPIPVPPIEEQHEIVRRLEALLALADTIDSRLQAATSSVEKITQAILAKAFRGELVPTEAELARIESRSYETAEELMARIRMSTTELTKKPRKRRVIKVTAENTLKFSEEVSVGTMTTSSVIAAVNKMKSAHFTFDELRKKVPGDYEALKQIVFDLLGQPTSGLTQQFDNTAEQMKLVRRHT